MLQFEDNAEQRPNAAALGLQSVADTVPSITATTLAAHRHSATWQSAGPTPTTASTPGHHGSWQILSEDMVFRTTDGSGHAHRPFAFPLAPQGRLMNRSGPAAAAILTGPSRFDSDHGATPFPVCTQPASYCGCRSCGGPGLRSQPIAVDWP